MARLVKLGLGGIGFALYAWIAGVRNLPRVKARKAARRARRRGALRDLEARDRA
jgi:hypothetical protein